MPVFEIILFQSDRENMLSPYAQVLLFNFLYATISHPYGRHIAKGFSSYLPLATLLPKDSGRFARVLYRPAGLKLSIDFVLRCFPTSTLRKASPSSMELCPYCFVSEQVGQKRGAC